MSKKRKVYPAEFKAKLVLEVLEGEKTLNEIASKNEILPKNLQNWKKQFIENMGLAFDKSALVKEYKEEIATLKIDKDLLAKKVGNLVIEKDFLVEKLKGSVSSRSRKEMIETEHILSVNKQLKLLSVSKSSLYYKAIEKFSSEHDIKLLNTIDEIYTEFPYYGTRRISEELKNRGILAGRKQVRSAMRYMGIQALYPKPKTTIANKEHAKYPYQLGQFKNDDNQVIVDTPNQVWSTDITYIRLAKGFVYLAAIIDWNTKKILSWKLSNSMDIYLTTSILNEALSLYPKPDIFNTDQGSQYTAKAHIDILVKNDIIISMDGKARSIDNICIERFWRSLKYEDVYLKSYENIKEARIGIGEYIEKYNTKRLHSAIGYKTPNEVYNKAINCINSEIDEVLPLVA